MQHSNSPGYLLEIEHLCCANAQKEQNKNQHLNNSTSPSVHAFQSKKHFDTFRFMVCVIFTNFVQSDAKKISSSISLFFFFGAVFMKKHMKKRKKINNGRAV